tara:strand:+ start:680 stop:943 length:264 start_codon:yes stop_codon:yes gene_type:complete
MKIKIKFDNYYNALKNEFGLTESKEWLKSNYKKIYKDQCEALMVEGISYIPVKYTEMTEEMAKKSFNVGGKNNPFNIIFVGDLKIIF